MQRGQIAWILSFMITAGSAYYQRITGPTYPLSGEAGIGPAAVPYRLERSHTSDSDAPVTVKVPDTLVSGKLAWRRFNTEDPWTLLDLRREGEYLRAELPAQPPAGKLEYGLALRRGSDSLTVPQGPRAVIRFKGNVPAAVLVVHIFLMFTGMLLSTRTGLSVFTGETGVGTLTAFTIASLTAGGLVLGPIVQKYAFGAYWTGWPFGTDLTDNKTVAALAGWIAVALVGNRVRRPQYWALAAAVITLSVYLIPHSLFGSELDYRSKGKGAATSARSVSVLFDRHADERAPDGGGHGGRRAAHGAPDDLV